VNVCALASFGCTGHEAAMTVLQFVSSLFTIFRQGMSLWTPGRARWTFRFIPQWIALVAWNLDGEGPENNLCENLEEMKHSTERAEDQWNPKCDLKSWRNEAQHRKRWWKPRASSLKSSSEGHNSLSMYCPGFEARAGVLLSQQRVVLQKQRRNDSDTSVDWLLMLLSMVMDRRPDRQAVPVSRAPSIVPGSTQQDHASINGMAVCQYSQS
jgi:hypothetical protein